MCFSKKEESYRTERDEEHQKQYGAVTTYRRDGCHDSEDAHDEGARKTGTGEG